MSYRPNFDLHNHTIHCGHAKGVATVQEIINRSEEIGLEYLGISEHVRFAEEVVQIESVRNDIMKLVIPKGAPKILLGCELDPDPVTMDGRFVTEVPGIDYTLLAMHRLPKSGIGVWMFQQQNYSDQERCRIGELWLEWLEACVECSKF